MNLPCSFLVVSGVVSLLYLDISRDTTEILPKKILGILKRLCLAWILQRYYQRYGLSNIIFKDKFTFHNSLRILGSIFVRIFVVSKSLATPLHEPSLFISGRIWGSIFVVFRYFQRYYRDIAKKDIRFFKALVPRLDTTEILPKIWTVKYNNLQVLSLILPVTERFVSWFLSSQICRQEPAFAPL